jgi:hypothetical protein
MPQLAFASTFWETYDQLERPAKAGVRKVMAKFQQLTVAELHADKGASSPFLPSVVSHS